MLALRILKPFGPNRVNWPGRSWMLMHTPCLLLQPVLQRDSLGAFTDVPPKVPATGKEFEIHKWNSELHLQSWEIDPTLAFTSSCREDGISSGLTIITPLPLLKLLVKNLVMGLMKNVAKNVAKKGLKNINEQQQAKTPEPWLKTKKPPPDAAA